MTNDRRTASQVLLDDKEHRVFITLKGQTPPVCKDDSQYKLVLKGIGIMLCITIILFVFL